MRHRSPAVPRFASLLLLAVLTVPLAPALPAAAEITVSREVGVPLQAAKTAFANKQYATALKEVERAASVKGATQDEKWAIEQMRATIYKAQGRFAEAATAFEAATKLATLSAADQAAALETLSQVWYRAGDYAKSAAYGEKAMAGGRRSDAFRQMVAEAYYRDKNPQKAASMARALIEEQRKAGRTPSAELLQFLAAAEFGAGNDAGYIKTLREQLRTESSRDNWQRLFDAMERTQKIPERLDLDWSRLKLAADAYENPDSYTEMAQLALVSELPGEALTILERGFSTGLLGNGPKAARQERMRDYAREQVARQRQELDERQRQAVADKDAEALAKIGMARATLGDPAAGMALMKQALAGKLRQPAAVRLRLAMVQFQTGQTKAAEQSLAALPANSDEARLGGLWSLLQAGRR